MVTSSTRFSSMLALGFAAGGCFFKNNLCDVTDCARGGSGGTTTTTSSSSAASSSTGAAQCVPSLTDAPMSDACGVFVDPANGDDISPGTMASPKKTLGAAVGAWMVGEAIYVGDGSVSDSNGVTLPAGIVVYGGLDRSTGYRVKANTARSTLAPTPGQIPLTLAGGMGSTEIYRIALNARAAAAPGASAVGIVVGAVNADIEEVDVVASDAANGADSTTPTDNVGPAAPSDPTIVGNAGAPPSSSSATPNPGGATKTNPLCASSSGAGGNGGAVVGGVGQPGFDAANGSATPPPSGGAPNDGLGGHGDHGTGCAFGHQGAAGVPGVVNGAGASGPSSLGFIALDGYHGVSGGVGGDGNPGQGGGGGGGSPGGSVTSGASGASGGAGGCGGKGAKGGGAGGSSIGMILLGMTAPTLVNVTLQVGKGGGGGAGALGEAGGIGGSGGTQSEVYACAGGPGGHGSAGGASGGGRGGHSIGITYATSAPSNGFMVTKQTGGAAGMTAGPGAAADAGVSADTAQLPGQ